MKLKKIKSKKKKQDKIEEKKSWSNLKNQNMKNPYWRMQLKNKKNIQKGEGHKLKFQKNEEYYSNILNQGDFHEFFNARH